MFSKKSINKHIIISVFTKDEATGTTEDEMVGWHHRPNGREFGQTPGDSEGQGSLMYCSLWGHKESDTI